MKSIVNSSDLTTSYKAGGDGKYTLSKFMNLLNEYETMKNSFHMTDILRQKDDQFKVIISSMRK